MAIARVMHLALLVGPIFLVGVFWIVLGDRPPIESLQGTAGYAIYGACAAGFAGGFLLRTRIPQRDSGQDEAGYWRAVLARAVLLWGLLEGLVLMGSVIGILAGQPVVVLLVVLIYLSLMILSSPARLTGDG